MAENNQELMKFVAWVKQTKIPDASPEEVVSQIQAMSQDQEQGVPMLQSWMEEFQAAEEGGETGMFKKGGKLDQLVEKRKIAKKAGGGDVEPEVRTTVEKKKKGNTRTKTITDNFMYPNTDDSWGRQEKTFKISGPKNQRDSTMSISTDMYVGDPTAWWPYINDGIYYTPNGAKKVWDNYRWWEKLLLRKPKVISPKDMKEFDDM